jgi:beclin 1
MGGTTNSHGFTLVGESGQQDVFISQKLAMSAELFDIISSNSDVDHPLCEECTDTLLDTMDQVNHFISFI